MDVTNRATVILDLETLASADSCRHCSLDAKEHRPKGWAAIPSSVNAIYCDEYEPIGWKNHAALGLSIGCYFSCTDQRLRFFDVHTLEATMRQFVETQPLLVTFNGIAFDFVLMRSLLHRRVDEMLACQEAGENQLDAEELIALSDAFATLCATSYDLLAEIWRIDPVRKFERGLNSLDAIAQASGLGAKLGHGAQAPRDWREGQYAKVINYCADDVYKTKALFEMVCEGKPLLRGDGQPIWLPNPLTPESSLLDESRLQYAARNILKEDTR